MKRPLEMAARADEGFPEPLMMSFYHQKCVRSSEYYNLHGQPIGNRVRMVQNRARELFLLRSSIGTHVS
jgi:hypothetical protein